MSSDTDPDSDATDTTSDSTDMLDDEDVSLYGDDDRPVETIDDAGHIPDEDFADPESDEWTLGEYRVGAVRIGDALFKLEEPEEDDDITKLISAITDGSLLFERTINILVTKPELSPDHLREKMTAKQRALLTERALSWFGINEFVDPKELQAAIKEQRANSDDNETTEEQ